MSLIRCGGYVQARIGMANGMHKVANDMYSQRQVQPTERTANDMPIPYAAQRSGNSNLFS